MFVDLYEIVKTYQNGFNVLHIKTPSKQTTRKTFSGHRASKECLLCFICGVT